MNTISCGKNEQTPPPTHNSIASCVILKQEKKKSAAEIEGQNDCIDSMGAEKGPES